jgi:hypothetical protein
MNTNRPGKMAMIALECIQKAGLGDFEPNALLTGMSI